MRKIYFAIPVTFLLVFGLPFVNFAQVVNINNGLHLVAKGPIQLVVDNGALKNDGVFTADSSTVIFDGGANAAVITGSLPVTFFNLTFRGTGTKSNNNDASVIATLNISGTTVFDADGGSNNQPFTLRSCDTATANVDVLTTGDIVGNVTVERFINTGTGAGQHAKTWQFLATPTTGQTYFQSWQENGTTPAGYGTWITGTGNGFDVTTAAASVKFYDQLTGSWTGITNTGSPLQNKLGYMLFVRGDRTVTTYNGIPNNTNMRSKGLLFTAFNPPPAVNVSANLFQSFGNPYASRIAFSQVYAVSTGINDVFYVWDPKLNGTYNYGGYQTLTGITGYVPSAGSATTYYPAGVPSPYLESGQAAFVQGNGSGGNINFEENCKVGGNRLVNRSPGIQSSFPGRQFFFTSLFTNTGMIADGNIVVFENGLGNDVNKNDAKKILNQGENAGIYRDGAIFAVEARNNIVMEDTIFYLIQNLKQQPYQFRFAPVNMSSDLVAFFIDKFNHTSTAISLTDSSFIDFTVDGNVGSGAQDRFMLVFKQAIVVPVTFISVSATAISNEKAIDVSWTVDNEDNIIRYEIEKSEDGSHFSTLGHTEPLANSGATHAYIYNDASPFNIINFYRIKAIRNDGQVQYSNIVKVEFERISFIAVYPNPVTDKTVSIRFVNQLTGNYKINISNKIGQIVYSGSVFINQNNMVKKISMEKITSAATYQLSIIKADGNKMVQQLIVK